MATDRPLTSIEPGRASSEAQGRNSFYLKSRSVPLVPSSLYRYSTDRDIHVQPGWIVRITDEAARYRECLPCLPRHAHADQVRPGDQAVRRVVFDPTCTGQIDAAPGVRAAAAPGRARGIVVQIAGHKT